MDTETAIKGIVNLRKQIHEQHLWNDPVALSDKMTKFAVYNAYLADDIARLHTVSTNKRIESFKKARTIDIKVTEASELATLDSLADREQYEQVKYIYTTTANLISVLQSRLRVIENQRKQEGVT